jgi:hypothetical protein
MGTDGSSTSNVRVWVAANGVSAQIGPETDRLSVFEWKQVFKENYVLAYGGETDDPYDHNKVRPGTLLAPALAR